MSADSGNHVLERVNSDCDADLALRPAPLLDEVGASHDVVVGQEELVDQDAVMQDEPVLVSVDGGKGAVMPFERDVVTYFGHLGSKIDRAVQSVLAHHKPFPCRELLAPVFDDCPDERSRAHELTTAALGHGGSEQLESTGVER